MIYKKNIYYQSHQSHHARFALANRFDIIRRSEHARTAFSRERREWLPKPPCIFSDGRSTFIYLGLSRSRVLCTYTPRQTSHRARRARARAR